MTPRAAIWFHSDRDGVGDRCDPDLGGVDHLRMFDPMTVRNVNGDIRYFVQIGP